MRVSKIDVDRLRVGPGDRVLDLGCARGEQTIGLAKTGATVVGADTDPELLDILRADAEREGVKVETWHLDVQQGLPQAGTFDAVVCTEVLEHVPDYRTAMAEIVRALKPGGRACIAVPTAHTELIFHRWLPTYVSDSKHVNVFTRSLLIGELERAGLRVEGTEGANFEWALFWLMHSRAGTRFDHTGVPSGNEHITRRYWRIRHTLMRLRIDAAVLRLGDRVLPKSLYVYGVKR